MKTFFHFTDTLFGTLSVQTGGTLLVISDSGGISRDCLKKSGLFALSWPPIVVSLGRARPECGGNTTLGGKQTDKDIMINNLENSF